VSPFFVGSVGFGDSCLTGNGNCDSIDNIEFHRKE